MEKKIILPKENDILLYLEKYTGSEGNHYLTPTALTNYLDCSLRFYFQYIAQLKKRGCYRDIEGAMFGRLLHASMEYLYASNLGEEISCEAFDKLLKENDVLEDKILKAFAREYFKKEMEIPHLHGKSIVVKEILLKYIRRILEIDKESAPLTLLSFENTFKRKIPVKIGERYNQIWIGGKIDRIDQTFKGYRVIDYKTGKVNYSFDSVEALFAPDGKKHNKEIFQILFYAYLIEEDKHFANSPIIPGIYGLRNIFKSDFDHFVRLKKDRILEFSALKDEFVQQLQGLMERIFNAEIPFTKTEDIKKCLYCPYKDICHR